MTGIAKYTEQYRYLPVGFTGTQRGLTTQQARSLGLVLHVLAPRSFHHGDCIGADEEAHNIFRVVCPDQKVVIYPPVQDNKRSFRKGDEYHAAEPYLVRNRHIVDETSYLIATPGEKEEQLRSGTWSTVRYARKQRRLIFLIHTDGLIYADGNA